MRFPDFLLFVCLADDGDMPAMSAARLMRWAYFRWQHRVDQPMTGVALGLLNVEESSDAGNDLSYLNSLTCAAVGHRQQSLWSSLDFYLQSAKTLAGVSLHSGHGLMRWAQPQLADAIQVAHKYSLKAW